MMRAQKSRRSNFPQDLFTSIPKVPPKVYVDLMHSTDIGKYFSEKIRPKFHTKQVAT